MQYTSPYALSATWPLLSCYKWCTALCAHTNYNVETALMLAARGGYTEIVKIVVEAGADITLRNKVCSWSQQYFKYLNCTIE